MIEPNSLPYIEMNELPFHQNDLENDEINKITKNFTDIHWEKINTIDKNLKKRLTNEMISMGYSYSVSDCALNYVFFRGISQALEFLEENENGIVGHLFFPSSKNQNCALCSKNENFHPPVEQYRPIIMSRNSSIDDKFVSPNETHLNKFKCMVCFERFEDLNLWSLKCNHKFCINCIHSYLNNELEISKVGKIKCIDVNCHELFTDEEIKNNITPQMFEKYQKFLELKKIIQNPNAKWCPRPGCGRYQIRNKNQLHMICDCGFEYCFKCSNPWHPQKKCEDVIEEGYSKWAQGQKVQYCPGCGIRTEKIEGCNHMTCSICGYEWCWLCRGTYSSLHYNDLNPFGCPSMQYENYTHPFYCLILKRIGIFFALILIAIGILIISGFVVVYSIYIQIKSKIQRHHRIQIGLCDIVIIILLLPIGGAITIILSPFILFFGYPGIIIYYFVVIIKQKIDANNRYQERLIQNALRN